VLHPQSKELRRVPIVTGLFATTLGLSATLLFWIQPLVAKSLLPLIGGSPAIWHTVIVFFQATLLIGYTYAHVLVKFQPLKRQILLHLGLILIAFWFLPFDRFVFSFSIDPMHPEWIPVQLWASLFTTIGLPCLLISSTSPLLQSWYRYCDVSDADDPYFLYAASNIGSLIALLAFPLFIESQLGLSAQFRYWSGGFILFFLLIIICQRHLKGGERLRRVTPLSPSTSPTNAIEPQSILPWLGYGFLGSSLMIGTTTFLTTEVMNAPLIAILPLATFLITFILAFSKRPAKICHQSGIVTTFAIIGVLFQMLTNATDPAWLVTLIHLALVFSGCLYLHLRLAGKRPAGSQLTKFYLWISVGGVGAGITHTFLAPLLFDRVWEYSLTIVTLTLLLNKDRKRTSTRISNRIGATTATLAVALFGLYAASRSFEVLTPLNSFPNLIIGVTLLATFLISQNPIRFATVIVCLLCLNTWRGDAHGKTLFIDRNFFGLSKVTLDPNEQTKRLVHGNTIHGRQHTDPDTQHLPLSYYHTAGPLRRIIKQYEAIESTSEVAVIGLGAGSMLFYGQPHQTWTLYEIDPLVIHLARDSGHFSYLQNPHVAKLNLEIGDARIELQKATDKQFDLIVLDAFSSDSIPMHLFTKEAIDLYLSKLADQGLLAFHISNRTLNLAPLLSRLADEFELVSLAWNDPYDDPNQGKDPSHWAVLSRGTGQLTKLHKDERWKALVTPPNTPLWTDERSNILEAR
jgi:hypothetical protein